MLLLGRGEGKVSRCLAERDLRGRVILDVDWVAGTRTFAGLCRGSRPRLGGQGSGGRLLFLGRASLHPALKDEDSGHTIHRLASLFNGEIGLAEETVGFGGGQALVPEVDWEFEVLAKFFGEGLYFLGLDAFGTTHTEGQADYDLFDLVIANQAMQV
jgi:hypothetical protein